MIAQNELELQVAERLPDVQVDLAGAVGALAVGRGYDVMYFANDCDYNHLAGTLAEINLRQRLYAISGSFGERMVVQPIPHKARKSGLEFRTDRLGALYIGPPGKDSACKIDALALIDGLPTIFEINLSKKYKSRGLEHRTGADLRAGGNFRQNRIRQLVIPISEYFNSPCGYVLILAPHNIKPNSPVQAEFKSKGGIIVPHYASYESYRAAVRQIGEEIKRARSAQIAERYNALEEMPTLYDEAQTSGFWSAIEMIERDLIKKALMQCGNNQSEAAKLIQLDRITLRRKMEQFGLHQKFPAARGRPRKNSI